MLNIQRQNGKDDQRPLNGLKGLIASKASILLDSTNSVVGCESASSDEFQELNAAHNQLAQQLGSNIAGLGNESADAMAQALMVCSDHDALKAAMTTHLGETVGNESFDSDSVVNNIHLTVGVAGEIAASVTDANFIFPKVVVDQKTTNYKLKAVRTVIEPKFYHAADGSVTDWGKMNLLNAAVKDNMLRKEQNVFVPELISGRESMFIDSDLVTPWTIKRSDGKEVTTSYLGQLAEDINLITISTAKGMDRNTENTILDRIDEGAKIKGVIVAFGADGVQKAVYLNTLNANHSTFTKSETESESWVRQVSFGKTTMMLNLENYVHPAQGGFAGIADVPELKALLDAGYTKVGFKVSNNYSLELSEGTFGATTAAPQVTYIEKSGEVGTNALDYAKANNAALLTALKGTFLGTDIQATLSNGTLKMDGDKLGSQGLEKLYPLSVRTPLEIRKDTLNKVDDTDAIKMLGQALMFRRDDETIAELHEWFQWAEANLGYEGAADVLRKDLDIIGLHYFLKPYVKRVQIKLSELLKEEDTTGKLAVLETGLVTKMQDELVQMFQETNYRTVVRTHGSDAKHVPEVNLFGDSRLTNYIMRTGEDRTFGDGRTMAEKPVIHPTDRESMRDVIYAMPRAASYENEKDRIFGFGHAIEITPVVVKRARDNGVTYDQIQIWPVYTNIVTTPMLLKFEVEGLEEYFAKASADRTVSA